MPWLSDLGDFIGPRSPLAEARSRFAGELQNPAVRNQVMALTNREVGGQGPEAQQAFLESLFNRATARGTPISGQMTLADRGGYYPVLGNPNSVGPASRQRYEELLDQVASGSNVSNYATGNASGRVGFAGGPQTFSSNGERFGVEGPDRRAMTALAGGDIPPERTGSVPANASLTAGKMEPTLLSQIGGNANPGFGDRLSAGLQGFANGGAILPAISNLLSGLATGQRADPQGRAEALSRSLAGGGTDYADMARKAFAAGNGDAGMALLKLGREQANTDRSFNENKRQFDLNYNKPQVVFKEDDEGNQVPFLVTPNGMTPVQQVAPGAPRPAAPGPQSALSGAPVDYAENPFMPPGATLTQAGNPAVIGVPPPGVRGKEYRKEFAKEQAQEDVRQGTRVSAGNSILGRIDSLEGKIKDPRFAAIARANPIAGEAREGSVLYNPARMAYELIGREKNKSHLDAIAQDAKAIELEFGQLFYKGQGAVSDRERAAVSELVGKITQARSQESALNLMNNLRGIVNSALKRVPGYNLSGAGAPQSAAPNLKQKYGLE